MKFQFIVIAMLLVSTSAWVDEDGRDSRIASAPSQSLATITVTIIDTFQLSAGAQMLGMDHQDTSSQLGVMDSDNSLIRGVETGTGDQVWSEPVPISNTFGLCHSWPAPYDWYVNSWTSPLMHFWDTSSDTWTTPFANPAGIYGRGLDYQDDGDYIWEAYSSPPATIGVYRISTSGASTNYLIPGTGPMSQLSGLALCPMDGYEVCIVITTYDYPEWFFYGFDGSGLTYLGSATPSVPGLTGSRGLTYCESSDSFFWTYKTTGDVRWISEATVSFSALEQSTWGGIKAGF